MPLQKLRAQRGARLPTRGEKQLATIAERNAWQDFALQWAKIGALAETLRQHAEREHAYALFDHRNDLVRTLDRTERLRGRIVERLCVELRKEIRRTEEDLHRYTDSWRADWIKSAMDHDEPEDTWRIVLHEHGVRPYQLDKAVRQKTAENRLRDRRQWLTERLEHCRDVLARIDGPGYVRTADGELEQAFDNAWNVPLDRWGNELRREHVINEIARLESALGALPAQKR